MMNTKEMQEYLMEELRIELGKMMQGKENKYSYLFMLMNDMGFETI